MKSLILAAGLLLLSTVPAQAAPSGSLRTTACSSSLDRAASTMAIEGRMRTVDGARKLQMRFDLQVLTPSRPRWTRLPAPGFGVWNTADPAPRRYVFEKRVEALAAPSRYRMIVRFRWLGDADRRIATDKRVSETCVQTDLRPDLSPERVSVGPGADAGSRRYVVPVTNSGRSSAGPFAVAMEVNGVPLTSAAVVTGLLADERSELVFSGPPCRPGTRLEVQVDPAAAVDEQDEADNRLSRPCPRP